MHFFNAVTASLMTVSISSFIRLAKTCSSVASASVSRKPGRKLPVETVPETQRAAK